MPRRGELVQYIPEPWRTKYYGTHSYGELIYYDAPDYAHSYAMRVDAFPPDGEFACSDLWLGYGLNTGQFPQASGPHQRTVRRIYSAWRFCSLDSQCATRPSSCLYLSPADLTMTSCPPGDLRDDNI